MKVTPDIARLGAFLVLFVLTIRVMAWSTTWDTQREAISWLIVLLFVAGWLLSHVMADWRAGRGNWPDS